MKLRRRANRIEIPVIETARLVLRPFEAGDLGALSVLQAEESFWWYPFKRGFDARESAGFLRYCLETYEAGELGLHAVIEKESGALAGQTGLSVPKWLKEVLPAVEAGWRLGSAYRGRGYATEAAAAAIRWGFEDLGFESILAIFDPENVASGRVMEHLGFESVRETEHPELGGRLEIRSLAAHSWAELVEAGRWPG